MLKTSVMCFLASYAVAFLCELIQLKWRHSLNRIIALVMGAAGLVAHTFYLLQRSIQSDLPPLLSSAHDWLLVLAYIVVLVYWFVSMLDHELAIGIVVWPVVLALVVSSQYVSYSPNEEFLLPYLRGWKMLHASMLVLGTAAVLQGFLLSLMYLWQHRRLKRRMMDDATAKLPNLELIQRLNRWSIYSAVPLLTIGVASGIYLTIITSDSNLALTGTDPVVIGGAITWILMGVLFVWLLLHQRSPGRQIALLTVWACGFLIVATVGLQLFVAVTGLRGVH